MEPSPVVSESPLLCECGSAVEVVLKFVLGKRGIWDGELEDVLQRGKL